MSQIFTIWKKEIKDTVRDRNTLIAMIAIPLLLMPPLLVGITKFVEYQMSKTAEQTVKISIQNKTAAPDLADLIKGQEKTQIVETSDLASAIKNDEIDAGVIIPDNFLISITEQKPVELKILRKSTNEKSGVALAKIFATITAYNNKILADRFAHQNINKDILSEIVAIPEDLATEKERGGFGLGFLLPLFIAIWSITGGQYTAIDVSAGEKERKTLEALLLTPAKRLDIVMGKLLAVATTALISVIISLTSLYFTIHYIGIGPISGNGQAQSGQTASLQGVTFDFSLAPEAIAVILGVSLLLVFLFSAVLLSICIFAKSFKEAQNYLSPILLIVILPISLLGSMPSAQINEWFFAIPAINAVLLFKEVLVGIYSFEHILITIVSLVIFSTIAIFAATKIYEKETVLFKS